MRFLVFLLLFCTSIFILSQMSKAGPMSSTNYQITSSVLSGGGSFISSDNYQLVSTFGQPTAVVKSSSLYYNLDVGFWYTMLFTAVGDVNGDGEVTLEDVIAALQIVTGQSPGAIVKAADADGDGKIGLIEALNVLSKLGE